MEDYALPENYEGGNLLTIKRLGEQLVLKNKDHHILNNNNTNKVVNSSFLKLDNGEKTKTSTITSNQNTKTNTEMKSIRDIIKLRRKMTNNISQKRGSYRSSISKESLELSRPSIYELPANFALPNPTRILFGMIYSNKTAQKIKEKAKEKFRWISRMIMIWTRYFNIISKKALRQQKRHLKTLEPLKNFKSNELNFNKSYFKATKEIELTGDSRKILNTNPQARTEEQVISIVYGLSSLSAFNEFPLHLQKKLCHAAYFRRIDADHVIIRQGHVAEYFYFIISGSAIVNIIINDQIRTVNRLTKGCSFGELALLHHSSRTASVVSVTPMQLLAIERTDFQQIFMNSRMSTGPNGLPEHILFLQNVDFVKNLNLDLMMKSPESCLINYYKNLSLIALNDVESPYIYVVKSGQCVVIKEIKVPASSFFPREDTISLEDIKRQIECYEDFKFKPIKLQIGIGNQKNISRKKTQQYFYFRKNDNKYDNNEEDNKDKSVVSIFLQLEVLQTGDVFGLSTLIFTQQDKIRTENMASVALVSNKAEIVLISKRFIVSTASDQFIDDIRVNVYQYPSEQVFQENYKTQQNWNEFRVQRYASTLNKIK